MAYLEQSTRYVPYTDRPHGRWKLSRSGGDRRWRAARALRPARWTSRSRPTRRWIPAMEDALPRDAIRRAPTDSEAVYRSVIRAKALDTLRGLLPAATHVERRPLRHRSGVTRRCCCACAPIRSRRSGPAPTTMLAELRKVIPAFLARVDQPDRGGRWIQYLAEHAAATLAAPPAGRQPSTPEPRDEVTLTEFDPDGEVKVVAAALYAASDLPDDQLLAIARRMSADERAADSARLRRRPRQPPPQARARVRAHAVPLRRPRRLRRLPRSAAPSPADARVAAA